MSTSLGSRGVVQAFLTRYFADEDAGTVLTLAGYQAAFPGHDAAIALAWTSVTAGPDPQGSSGERCIGPFELLREIGRGAQGIVHLARDPRLDRQVALKVLGGIWTPKMLERFQREARLGSRVRHPQVCEVFDVGVDDGVPWIAMAYVPGESLAERLAAAGPLSSEKVLRIGEQLALALDAAHRVGVVHRDVKPANVRLTAEDRCVLTDFGVARDAEGAGTALTMQGEFLGTLHYAAPETLEGHPASPASDVYSLGVLLHELLTARLPFDAPTRAGLMRAILLGERSTDLRGIQGIDDDLVLVIETATARRREDRYRSALALAEDLRAVRERRSIAVRRAGPLTRLRRWTAREPRLAAALGAALLVLMAGLAVALTLLDRVVDERAAKQRALDEIGLLADRTRIDELEAAIATLEPAWPARIAAIEDWLASADELETHRAEHDAALASLRAAARPRSEAEFATAAARHPVAADLAGLEANLAHLERRLANESDTEERAFLATEQKNVVEKLRIARERLRADLGLHFEDRAIGWRHGLQSALVLEFERFFGDDPQRAPRERVRAMLAHARAIAAWEATQGSRAWGDCIAAIADPERSPAYGGLKIAAQPGLVPLGADPQSGLHEFADPRSGAIPVRDPSSGALRIDEGSGIVFVLLPGGTVRIGAVTAERAASGETNLDPRAEAIDGPPHDVELAPFLLGKFEVDQAQWLRLVGRNPSQAPPGTRYRDQAVVTALHPVEAMTWLEAVEALSRIGATLPTSAQWEYAARATSRTAFFCGDEPESLRGLVNLNDLALRRVSGQAPDAEARLLGDDGFAGHAPIGSFAPNRFGLHDLVGNVQEWCRDVDHRYDSTARPGDGLQIVGNLADRVIRGGSYVAGAAAARSAARTQLKARLARHDLGLRAARTLQ